MKKTILKAFGLLLILSNSYFAGAQFKLIDSKDFEQSKLGKVMVLNPSSIAIVNLSSKKLNIKFINNELKEEDALEIKVPKTEFFASSYDSLGKKLVFLIEKTVVQVDIESKEYNIYNAPNCGSVHQTDFQAFTFGNRSLLIANYASWKHSQQPGLAMFTSQILELNSDSKKYLPIALMEKYYAYDFSHITQYAENQILVYRENDEENTSEFMVIDQNLNEVKTNFSKFPFKFNKGMQILPFGEEKFLVTGAIGSYKTSSENLGLYLMMLNEGKTENFKAYPFKEMKNIDRFFVTFVKNRIKNAAEKARKSATTQLAVEGMVPGTILTEDKIFLSHTFIYRYNPRFDSPVQTIILETEYNGELINEHAMKMAKWEKNLKREIKVQSHLKNNAAYYTFEDIDDKLKIYKAEGKNTEPKNASVDKKTVSLQILYHWHDNVYIGFSNIVRKKDPSKCSFTAIKVEW
ncbi:MAG: hypothetical protein H6605_09860 [Flavobacteriales bacterium]|nr:hypothetical protein [Flavobacteriales bacterium]